MYYVVHVVKMVNSSQSHVVKSGKKRNNDSQERHLEWRYIHLKQHPQKNKQFKTISWLKSPKVYVILSQEVTLQTSPGSPKLPCLLQNHSSIKSLWKAAKLLSFGLQSASAFSNNYGTSIWIYMDLGSYDCFTARIEINWTTYSNNMDCHNFGLLVRKANDFQSAKS